MQHSCKRHSLIIANMQATFADNCKHVHACVFSSQSSRNLNNNPSLIISAYSATCDYFLNESLICICIYIHDRVCASPHIMHTYPAMSC